VWSDSVEVGGGDDGAWDGPDAALAVATVRHLPTHAVRARSVFRAEGGDFGATRYALTFERGDSARWIRWGTSSGQPGPFGAMGRHGDHVWNVAASWTHGAHTLSGTIGQRGAAQELGHAHVTEDAGGQSGAASYAWAGGGRHARLEFSRGLDH